MTTSNGTEEPTGRLGAVLRARAADQPVALGKHGPWLATTLEHARRVLTTPDTYDFPSDVSRRPLGAPDAAEASSRSQHAITPPLSASEVADGAAVFAAELERLDLSSGEVDAMMLLRVPVSRSTTAAVLPAISIEARNEIAELVVDWVDALGPIIAAKRPPGRWSSLRKRETRSRLELEAALGRVDCPEPASTAVVLAAGIQVPIAAGAWLLVQLAEDDELQVRLAERGDLDRAVAWETVRLRPPTWITARITTEYTELGDARIPPSAVVWVSPLLLGHRPELIAADAVPADVFDPFRWDQDRVRPGAWLPFGAGPHACPGRNLGLVQLSQVAGWARAFRLAPVAEVHVNQSRGIFPEPARLRVTAAK